MLAQSVPDLVGVKDLANRVSARCTVTEPDILAVISALVFEMNQVPKAGNRVKLDGLGTFRVGIHSSGVRRQRTSIHSATSLVLTLSLSLR